MLYKEIIAVCSEIHTKHINTLFGQNTVCSEIHTKHINTLCGQNVEFVNVKPGGTYSNHRVLEQFGDVGVWVHAFLYSALACYG
jgi:hypothetical protein